MVAPMAAICFSWKVRTSNGFSPARKRRMSVAGVMVGTETSGFPANWQPSTSPDAVASLPVTLR